MIVLKKVNKVFSLMIPIKKTIIKVLIKKKKKY